MPLPDGLITGRTANLPGDWKQQATAAPQSRSKPTPGVMNKTESLYALELECRLRAGDIRGWWFEPFKLRLAKRTWYTIDFFVQHVDGSCECVEIKGGHTKAGKLLATDDAIVKFKMARELFRCFRFTMLAKSGGGFREVLK